MTRPQQPMHPHASDAALARFTHHAQPEPRRPRPSCGTVALLMPALLAAALFFGPASASSALAQTAPYQPPLATDPPPPAPGSGTGAGAEKGSGPATTKSPDADPAPAPVPAPGDDLEGLIGRGLDKVLNDMFTRAQPHLEGLAKDLGGLMDEYGPALSELSGLIDDIRHYEAPERLPNGDVLIRRKPDAPPPPPLDQLRKIAPPDGRPANPDLPPGGSGAGTPTPPKISI